MQKKRSRLGVYRLHQSEDSFCFISNLLNEIGI